jgi:pantoate--beta-alanine ligase
MDQITTRRPAIAGLRIVRTVKDLRQATQPWRARGDRIGLVPTMGALHDGHLALVRAAKARGCRAIATIFVNPKQFGPREDFAAYPRGEARDVGLLESADCDLLFAPNVDEMYPPGFATAVRVASLTDHLCGPHRPGHFEGVATVVCKLLAQALPDFAFFGEKDYQQLKVIGRMARDLDLPVEIVGVETVREADGMAMSSRNAYLTSDERRIATALNRILLDLAAAVRAGEAPRTAEAKAAASLKSAGFPRIDYVSVADAETLAPAEGLGRPLRALAAAWLGETRLIDNVAV